MLTAERRRVVARRLDERSLKVADAAADIAPCIGIAKIGHANLACDGRGTTVFQQPLRQRAWLQWVDAQGRALGPRSRELDTPSQLALAPDQKKVAFVTLADNDLWFLDLDHPIPTRLTFLNLSQTEALYSPVWSPDSRRIAYAAEAGTIHDIIHVISLEASRDTAIFEAPSLFAQPLSWTPDGTSLAATCTDSTGNDLWTIPVEGPGRAERYERTPAQEFTARVSPDGRWVACAVAIEGRNTIQILSWPRPGVRHQLALDAELSTYVTPAWCDGGRTLAILDARGRVIAVPVQLEGGFRQGEPRIVFTPNPGQLVVEPGPDLKRFLIIEREPLSNPAPLRVLTYWPARTRP